MPHKGVLRRQIDLPAIATVAGCDPETMHEPFPSLRSISTREPPPANAMIALEHSVSTTYYR
jgi:hypothetical protein